jgi:hypothetical protein
MRIAATTGNTQNINTIIVGIAIFETTLQLFAATKGKVSGRTHAQHSTFNAL